MKWYPWVTLQEALEDLLAPAPLRTIFDIGQVFAHEPKAPKGDWTVAPKGRGAVNRQRAYVVRRMAESANVDVRSAQRWIAKFVVEERNPSKKHMQEMRAAAAPSQVEAKVLDLEVVGTNVDLTATITIYSTRRPDNFSDSRHRTIMGVYIESDGHLRNEADRVWQPFIDLWRAGQYPEATEAWQAAYFDAMGIGSGTGEIDDVEMLVMSTLEAGRNAA